MISTKPHTKVKAFTLSEMIVVLILTSIVVGLAFSVLSLVQKQMFAIQSNYNKNLDLNTLETTLWLDFNRYSNIMFHQDENTLKFTNNLDSIVYQFEHDKVVRAKDTFAIQIEDKQVYFNGEHSNSNQLDAIKLQTGKAFQNQSLFIYKSNDAAIYMNE